MALVLTSPAFADNGAIPKQYTCEGADISPPLNWSAAPQGTKTFALIVDDPDAPDPRAPKMTWVHWVIQNIPADAQSLPEGAAERGMPAGALQGLNDWKLIKSIPHSCKRRKASKPVMVSLNDLSIA